MPGKSGNTLLVSTTRIGLVIADSICSWLKAIPSWLANITKQSALARDSWSDATWNAWVIGIKGSYAWTLAPAFMSREAIYRAGLYRQSAQKSFIASPTRAIVELVRILSASWRTFIIIWTISRGLSILSFLAVLIRVNGHFFSSKAFCR